MPDLISTEYPLGAWFNPLDPEQQSRVTATIIPAEILLHCAKSQPARAGSPVMTFKPLTKLLRSQLAHVCGDEIRLNSATFLF